MRGSTDFTAFAWITTHPVLYNVLAALHMVGAVVLLGSLLLLELRVWGFGAALPVQALSHLALRVTLAGVALAGASGLALFVGQPAELLANRVFVAKMVLVMFAGLNAASFHSRGSLERLDGVARAQTLLSLGLWVAVIFCGRWLAVA